MTELWRGTVKELETGTLRFRNAPHYSKTDPDWWPINTCVVCKHPFKEGFIGYTFDYLLSEDVVRLMGAGYFCAGCENRSRAVTRALNRYDLISRTKKDWDAVIVRPGHMLHPQVYQVLPNDPIVLPFGGMLRAVYNFELSRLCFYMCPPSHPPPLKSDDLRKVAVSSTPKKGDGIKIVEDGCVMTTTPQPRRYSANVCAASR